MVAGPAAVRFGNGLKKAAADAGHECFEREKRRQEEVFTGIYRMNGPENPYRMAQELGDLMTENVTVVRYNDRLKATDDKLREFQERWNSLGILDTARGTANQSAQFARQLKHMLDLARVITVGALLRNESRGAHYKPEYPDRDDTNFLKTTIAEYTPNGPRISYEEVDLSFIEPRQRVYNVEKQAAARKEGN
jgi:succinate dehydrogenase / fumarate reductase flavoprotein subunit